MRRKCNSAKKNKKNLSHCFYRLVNEPSVTTKLHLEGTLDVDDQEVSDGERLQHQEGKGTEEEKVKQNRHHNTPCL